MKQTIALVDDDRNILTSVSMTLEQEGFTVRTYTDGESALQGITGDRPDLNRVPNRGQLARALHRLRRDPAKVAALLEQVDVLAGAARRR